MTKSEKNKMLKAKNKNIFNQLVIQKTTFAVNLNLL